MQEHEIHTGKGYIVKIANHEVKVKVLSNTCRGWVAKTTSGKFIPINSIDRFVRAVEPTQNQMPNTPVVPFSKPVIPPNELPSQTPVTEAGNQTTVPEPKTSPQPENQQNGNATVPVSQTEAPANVQQNEAVPATPTPEPKNKLTMLDAAAIVLEKAGHPMSLQDILDCIIESNLWAPGTGKTPKNTLQAAFSLEIGKRVKRRFHKTEPGTFEYIGGSSHE